MDSHPPTDTHPLKWRRSPDATHRTLAGMTVVRLLADDQQVKLHSLASLVWVALQLPSTSVALLEDLRSIGMVVTKEEVVAELEGLAACGLVAHE